MMTMTMNAETYLPDMYLNRKAQTMPNMYIQKANQVMRFSSLQNEVRGCRN